MPTIAEAFAVAVGHHHAGRLQEAEEIYRQILNVEPSHAGAWHLLGVIAHQASQHDVALEFIERSVELGLDEAEVHNNLGLVFQALRKWEDAARCHTLALQRKRNLAEAHSNLGLCLNAQGKHAEARTCFW